MPGLRPAGGAGLAPVLLGTLRRRRPAALARRRLCGAGRRGRGNGRRRKALKVRARAGQAQASPLYSRSDAPRPAARPDAQVAQLVEHATENRSVGGSIPPLGTKIFLIVSVTWLLSCEAEASSFIVPGHAGDTDWLRSVTQQGLAGPAAPRT